jgi:3-hydroxyisobutyrate dehydrogenase-like beta-hydroxyacid dehydrogenase
MYTIGFIGLGAMGSRIADRFLDAGHRVYATNRTAAKAQPLIERGLIWLHTPREVAATADVVFSMVTDDAALEAITAGRRARRRPEAGTGLRRHEHRQPAGEPQGRRARRHARWPHA